MREDKKHRKVLSFIRLRKVCLLLCCQLIGRKQLKALFEGSSGAGLRRSQYRQFCLILSFSYRYLDNPPGAMLHGLGSLPSVRLVQTLSGGVASR